MCLICTNTMLINLLELHQCLQCCWLYDRKGIWPVKTEWWGAGMFVCLEQVADWCHCHSLSLASVKSRLVLPFWYRLTRVVPEKGTLNRCVCRVASMVTLLLHVSSGVTGSWQVKSCWVMYITTLNKGIHIHILNLLYHVFLTNTTSRMFLLSSSLFWFTDTHTAAV